MKTVAENTVEGTKENTAAQSRPSVTVTVNVELFTAEELKSIGLTVKDGFHAGVLSIVNEYVMVALKRAIATDNRRIDSGVSYIAASISGISVASEGNKVETYTSPATEIIGMKPREAVAHLLNKIGDDIKKAEASREAESHENDPRKDECNCPVCIFRRDLVKVFKGQP